MDGAVLGNEEAGEQRRFQYSNFDAEDSRVLGLDAVTFADEDR
jgi:hypothetical protein